MDMKPRTTYAIRVISQSLDDRKIPYKLCDTGRTQRWGFHTELVVDVSRGQEEILLRVRTNEISVGEGKIPSSVNNSLSRLFCFSSRSSYGMLG